MVKMRTTEPQGTQKRGLQLKLSRKNPALLDGHLRCLGASFPRFSPPKPLSLSHPLTPQSRSQTLQSISSPVQTSLLLGLYPPEQGPALAHPFPAIFGGSALTQSPYTPCLCLTSTPSALAGFSFAQSRKGRKFSLLSTVLEISKTYFSTGF